MFTRKTDRSAHRALSGLFVAALAIGTGSFTKAASAQDEASSTQKLPAGAISLTDGRFFFGQPIIRTAKGARLVFEHGSVDVPKAMIRDLFASKDEVAYEPKNDKEREKLAKGQVKFQGRWLSKSAAAKKIEKLQKDLAKRIETQKEYKLWRNRRKVEDRYFKYEHNLPEALFKELQSLMTVYYKTFLRYWGKKPKNKIKPTVNLYADYDDFAQISGASGGVVGWYHLLSKNLHVYWDRTDPEFTIDVLFHEANHMLVDLIDGPFRYPQWIEEPMAEYYGASKWLKDKKKMSIGHLQAGRFAEIRGDMANDEWMKLETLLGASSYRSYTWGWSFVYFLMQTPKYEKKWKKLYLDLAHSKKVKKSYSGPFKTVDGDVVKTLILKRLGHKVPETLQKEWWDFLKKIKIDETDGLERAGRKLRTMGKNKEARKLLADAISKGAKSPFTYASYARLLNKPGQRAERMKMIDKAIEIDPLEAEFYYIKANFFRFMTSKKDLNKARRLALLAHDINPESWKYLALATELEETIKALDK